ncbi:RagB/SusD family nutrient uptake outer membrane protein [Pedobacter nyackensis]|uniref:RagB/SusD family nutrient uptake outer membrane protein n=1 Tax=Pedobacter nyackensis TaxID=475255 RepID=UPI002930E183|nr:RagB/SusD family nutrient uptake outer membrane protein [Pedobacter nyackensis]
MKINILVALLGMMVVTSSCNKYLEEPPSKNSGVEISTTGHLDALLNKASYSTFRTQMVPGLLYSTDSYEMTPEMYTAGFRRAGTKLDIIQFSLWETPYVEKTNYLTSYWASAYEGIFMANLVLTNIEKVTGTEAEKAKLKARAHMLRAYSYFEIVQYYCLPYGKNTVNEPGLPLKVTTGYEEATHRVSLQTTYNFIEADIQEALKLDEPLFQNGVRLSWKETTAGANALAARFYLAIENYAKAQEAAEKVLTYDDYVRDYGSGEITQVLDVLSGKLVASNTTEANFHTTFLADWDRAFYNRTPTYMVDYTFPIASKKLQEIFGNHNYDLRKKLFLLDDMKNVSTMKIFVGNYFDKDANGQSMKVPGFYQHGRQYMTLAPNVVEMILTKAEAMARLGNYQQAMTELNKFRKYRIDKNAPDDIAVLKANNAQEAVKHILEERHREFPYTVRWLDIRRINFNQDPNDDVTLTKTFFPVNANAVDYAAAPIQYTLKPGSRKYAAAIPMEEIKASNGTLEQNKY